MSKHILIVDDSKTVRNLVAFIMKKEGFKVTMAEDGLDGLEKLYSSEQIDLIISDINMPRMDGLELVDRLKRDERTAHIPLLMLTAADSEDNELKLLNRGVDDFMSKASSADVLVARLHRLLARGAASA